MELFALDLGNKQTKLKSNKAEYVLPSQILNENDLPQQLGNLGNLGIKRDITMYKTPFDEQKWAWGTDLVNLKLDDYLQDTLMYRDRYSNHTFKLLANFALGLLATDFEKAKNEIMSVTVVAGVPTEDYNSKEQLRVLAEVLKGQHQVEIDGTTVNVKVETVLIIPQPIGTFYNVLLDDEGKLEREELLDERVGIVDIGGGTILIDTLLNFEFDKKARKQYSTGANDLYEAIASRIEDNVSLYQIEKLVRTGIAEKQFSYKFSKNNILDITEIVEQEIRSFSRRLVSQLRSTFKDIKSIDTLIITGGTSNIIDQAMVKEVFENVVFVDDAEMANVRGFYKYGVTEAGDQQ